MGDEPTVEQLLSNIPSASGRAFIRAQIANNARRDQQRGDVRSGSGLSAGEQASLEKFKYQLAESNIDQRHLQINGGEKAMEQKARAAESWLHANPHK